jgi:hypothetical protein
MLKKQLMFLIIFSFTMCNGWADIIKEPKIVKINDYLLVYENVETEIIKNVRKEEILERKDGVLKISKEALFLKEIVKLYNLAIEQAPGVTDKERFWVYNDDKDNEIGIFFDKKKNLIFEILY